MPKFGGALHLAAIKQPGMSRSSFQELGIPPDCRQITLGATLPFHPLTVCGGRILALLQLSGEGSVFVATVDRRPRGPVLPGPRHPARVGQPIPELRRAGRCGGPPSASLPSVTLAVELLVAPPPALDRVA